MAKISLQNIAKRYPNQERFTVEDFNLEIADQEFIVLVGPSGCGKSTTLRMIAGLETITAGSFLIDGKLMNDVAPKDRQIAMVFQNYALYPHMSVYKNLSFGLKLRKYAKDDIDSRVKQAASILGLTEYLDRKPATLSGGQRQRVAMGRAIVRDAEVFLMDEPLSNLDAKLRESMRAEIAKLHQRLKSTTVYVTHDQTEAMTLADRIVIMDQGKIQQIGSPVDVYNHPANVFVAGFIGSPAINFFDVRVENGYLVNDAGFKLKLSALALSKLPNLQPSQELTLGIRPEDIKVSENTESPEAGSTIEVEITVVETLGANVILHAKGGENEFVSRLNAGQYGRPGDKVTLWFNLERAHFFDKTTQQNLVSAKASNGDS
ncbi:MAG: sn-glycerol-3-phosphate ABC transporter ATP-binding protein UgpC [Bifidobacteriaceae bacterium]|jgi:multiple sugar transport system ATP-binding protein|nr:sn-glycerol-3-phosphate ABC transporter ATP-binding protein UgpC [Bifidobacteriaceae bacterium]